MKTEARAPKKKSRGRPRDDSLVERRREQILVAATKLFAAHGYADADTQKLADQLKTAKGTLYRYFPSKEKLFFAAVDRGMTSLREHVDGSIKDIADPLKRVTTAVRAYLEHFDRHPEIVELLIQERAVFKDRKKPTYFVHRERNIGRWIELFQDLIAARRVRDIPVSRITDVLSGVLYGTMFINFFVGRKGQYLDQARDIVDVMYRGILSESERSHQDCCKVS